LPEELKGSDRLITDSVEAKLLTRLVALTLSRHQDLYMMVEEDSAEEDKMLTLALTFWADLELEWATLWDLMLLEAKKSGLL